MKRYYLETISGRRRGPLAMGLRTALSAATVPYYAGHTARKLLYRMGLLRSVRLGAPVVSVGNLTCGGTGKTPLVEHIARWFAARNLRTAILARGYGRIDPAGRDDEEVFAEMDIEKIARLTGANRVASAKRAMRELKPDVFLLDDGFQHFRIRRDLDILAVDATNPFADGRLIPRGLLRERPACAKRADLIVLTRCDQADPQGLHRLAQYLGELAPGTPVIESVHKPVHVRMLSTRKREAAEWLRDRPVYAFCGIGNPEAFVRTLESLGAQVMQFRAFDDHHLYTPQEVRQINAAAQEFMTEAIVTTEKDAKKLNPDGFGLPLTALAVEIEILRGEKDLETMLGEVAGLPARVADTAAAP